MKKAILSSINELFIFLATISIFGMVFCFIALFYTIGLHFFLKTKIESWTYIGIVAFLISLAICLLMASISDKILSKSN